VADSRTSRRWYFLQLLFAALGAATSLYLLVQHTRLKSGIQGDSSFCVLGQYADCNVVNASAYAEIFGIPLAALGTLYFLALFLLGALQGPSQKSFRRSQVWMARLALCALAIDVWLTGIQFFALHSFCLLCAFTYVCTIAHLVLNLLLMPTEKRQLRNLWVAEAGAPIPSLVWAVNAAALALASFVLYQSVSTQVNTVRTATQEQNKKTFLESWSQLPSAPITVQAGDPIWGNALSKIQIVVFSDFECPHCQRAAFAMHTALAPERERVHVVFKQFPLDNTCNPLLQEQMHPNSCALAHLGYCANQKGRFWEFHDRVFFRLSPRELSSSRDQIFEGVKPFFTRKEFDDCLTQPEAVAHTQSNIDQGRDLQINSTPTLFINGKKVSLPPTVDLLRELVQKEADALQ
jgi:protein-disulfide isomerase/uncharacterized membrane protein